MNETILTILWVVLWQIVFYGIILGMILAIAYYYNKRQKWIDNMNKTEREKWERYQKYKKAKKGNLKGLLFLIGFIAICVLMMIFWDIKMAMLLMAIIYIPIILMQMEFALKTRNRGEIIRLIAILFMFIAIVVWMFEKMFYGWPFMLIGLILLNSRNLTMETENREMNLYNNLIVTAGSEIDSQLNGYSGRPYSKESKLIKNNLKNSNFRKLTDDFAKTIGKELIFMDWKIENDVAIFYPVVMPISQIYLMFHSLRKSKLSWIKLNSDGRITVFVSKNDYDKILEPVTYHLLCRNLAEKFEESFVEFAKGNTEISIKILRGDENE